MTASDLLPLAVLRRKAVVYIRQSTPSQVQMNLESQRRQYELINVARRRGFQHARGTSARRVAPNRPARTVSLHSH
jgi:DNA invertase Pin-like site-specific DNA recombinase